MLITGCQTTSNIAVEEVFYDIIAANAKTKTVVTEIREQGASQTYTLEKLLDCRGSLASCTTALTTCTMALTSLNASSAAEIKSLKTKVEDTENELEKLRNRLRAAVPISASLIAIVTPLFAFTQRRLRRINNTTQPSS